MTPDDERNELEAYLTCMVGPVGAPDRKDMLRVPEMLATYEPIIVQASALPTSEVMDLAQAQQRQSTTFLELGHTFQGLQAHYRAIALVLARLKRLESQTQ